MLLCHCSLGWKVLRTNITWARHVFYRRAASDFFLNSLRQLSTRQASLPQKRLNRNSVGRDGETDSTLAERIKQKTLIKKERRKPRKFTVAELEEEQKFDRFLSDRNRKEEDTFGTLDGHTDEGNGQVFPLSIEDTLEMVSHTSDDKRNNLPTDWSERFGSLGGENSVDPIDMALDPSLKYSKEIKEEEIEKIHNHIPLGRRNRRHEPDWYSRRIMKLGQKGHIAQAITVFDEWMLKEDRVKPTDFEYSVLIAALGKVGYTKKAFKLFYEMVQKKYRIHPKVLTALFNACSNSPWPEDGLRRANGLRRFMLIREIRPEYITYQAMIKAFGMCGDLNMALQLADESMHFHRVTDNLLSSLLVGCISDKTAGFRHAVMVWQKFQRIGIRPCVRSYKLLLKATQECGVGEQKLVQKLLKHDSNRLDNNLLIPSRKNTAQTSETNSLDMTQSFKGSGNQTTLIDEVSKDGNMDKTCFDKDSDFSVAAVNTVAQRATNDADTYDNLSDDIPEDDSTNDIDVASDVGVYEWNKRQDNHVLNQESLTPNILDPNADFSQVLSFGKVTNQKDRFALLGGLSGFLQMLRADGIKPDVEFFTQMIDLVPIEETDVILDVMIKANIKPDTVFFNRYFGALIYNREKQFEDLVGVMKELNIVPDALTFSTLALGCKNIDNAASFFVEMEKNGIMPDPKIMYRLIKASGQKYSYKKYLLNQMIELDIKPNKKILTLIEDQISRGRQTIIEMDKGVLEPSKHFIKSYDRFLKFYEDWAMETDMMKEEHPWKGFSPDPDNYQIS